MTHNIAKPEFYFDRTVQLWHRSAMPVTYYAYDLDLYGFCPHCRDPLYLLEGTTDRDKNPRALIRLAEILEVPAFLVRHDRNGDLVRVTRLATEYEPRVTVAEADWSALADHLADLRIAHDRIQHPEVTTLLPH